MKVAEKDSAVCGMLEDEYQRCCDVLESLQKKAELYPRGSLNVRRKQYNGKEYIYHYLVLREGQRVVNRHVSVEKLPQLTIQLEQRDKCKKEILVYKKRIAYLEKLLHIGKSKMMVLSGYLLTIMKCHILECCLMKFVVGVVS